MIDIKLINKTFDNDKTDLKSEIGNKNVKVFKVQRGDIIHTPKGMANPNILSLANMN